MGSGRTGPGARAPALTSRVLDAYARRSFVGEVRGLRLGPRLSKVELHMRSRTIRRWAAVALLAGGLGTAGAGARADVPQTITNQGRLFDSQSEPIAGPLKVLF